MEPSYEDDAQETQPLTRRDEDNASDASGSGGGSKGNDEVEGGTGEGPVGECRICGEESPVGELEVPCKCSGSVKYAHFHCIQRWCDEKRDTICEMCLGPFQASRGRTYTAGRPAVDPPVVPPPNARLLFQGAGGSGELRYEIIDGGAAEREQLEEERSASQRFRTMLMLIFALLLLRHAGGGGTEGDGGGGQESLVLFLLRVMLLMLPFLVIARMLGFLWQARTLAQQTPAQRLALQRRSDMQAYRERMGHVDMLAAHVEAVRRAQLRAQQQRHQQQPLPV